MLKKPSRNKLPPMQRIMRLEAAMAEDQQRLFHYERVWAEDQAKITRLQAAFDDILNLQPLNTQHEYYIAMLKALDIARKARTE